MTLDFRDWASVVREVGVLRATLDATRADIAALDVLLAEYRAETAVDEWVEAGYWQRFVDLWETPKGRAALEADR